LGDIVEVELKAAWTGYGMKVKERSQAWYQYEWNLLTKKDGHSTAPKFKQVAWFHLYTETKCRVSTQIPRTDDLIGPTWIYLSSF
jgi:hypothetical protein